MKKVRQYIKRTPDLGKFYCKEKTQALKGYTNSDWVAYTATRRLTDGYLFSISRAPVSWIVKCQLTVALSSCKAEYMALTQAAKAAIWLQGLVKKVAPKAFANTVEI